MDMLGALLGGQQQNVVRQLGQQFGLDDSQASAALGALLPAVAAGVKREASSPQGLEGLLGALASGSHQRYVDDPGALAQPETVEEGNGILGRVFGSKEVSREVAQRASTQSGLGPDVLKQMLPLVATMVMGALARRQSGGALGGALGGSLGGALGGALGAAPRGGSMTGGAAVAGGGLLDALAPMLDANKDGSIADDVMKMLGRFSGGR